MIDAGFGLGYLLGLFAVVAFGAVVPVVPTGAAVSVGAALGEHDHALLLLLVIAFGAAGAYAGDVATYALLRLALLRLARRPLTDGSGRIARWIEGQRTGAALMQVQRQLGHHELRTLLLSRLVPAGRIPVLLAAAVGGYSWRRFAVADIASATLWSTAYAVIGVAGRSIFPQPWQGAAAAILLVGLVSAAGNRWASRRQAHEATRSIDG